MGTFILISAIMAIILAWNCVTLLRGARRADIVIYSCALLLAWGVMGVACLADMPSLYRLIFG